MGEFVPVPQAQSSAKRCSLSPKGARAVQTSSSSTKASEAKPKGRIRNRPPSACAGQQDTKKNKPENYQKMKTTPKTTPRTRRDEGNGALGPEAGWMCQPSPKSFPDPGSHRLPWVPRTSPGAHGRGCGAVGRQTEGLSGSARRFTWLAVSPGTLRVMRLHGISKQIKARPQTRRLPLTSLLPFFFFNKYI